MTRFVSRCVCLGIFVCAFEFDGCVFVYACLRVCLLVCYLESESLFEYLCIRECVFA